MKPTRAPTIALTGLILAALLGGANPLVPAGASPAPAFSESFAGGTFPPAGWSDPDHVWTREANCPDLDGSACASISTSAAGRHDLRLPSIDTSHLTSPVLTFDLFVSDPTPSIMLNVLRYSALGPDGIANPYVQGGSQGKQQVTVPLTGAGSDFAIGFSQTGTGGYVKVDNVVVAGDFHNSAPVATDRTVATNEDAAVPITLQGHDTDGDNITFAIASNPAHGTLSGSAPTINYQPAKDWNGTDTFTFVTNDGTVDSNPATVTVNVGAINDAPVVTGPAAVTTTPGTPAFFQSAFSNAIAFADPDVGSAPFAAYLVSTGAMTLGRTTGLTFTNGDGTNDTAMNFTGTLTDVNAALDGLRVFAPAGGGSFNLTIGGDDGGASGPGGAHQVERTIPITVSSVATYQVDALVASQGTDIAGATGDGIRVAPTAVIPDSQRVTLP
ncbi:MAG TPA: Ig-like domain-containing protein, partial [Acidimicrobiia bacterium]|nr:Ig-like domain-containing protein [Acidimicrobiia bacterium]